jgi:predicted transcriptional regulator
MHNEFSRDNNKEQLADDAFPAMNPSLEELKRKLAEGMRDIEEGRVRDAEEVFAELYEKWDKQK